MRAFVFIVMAFTLVNCGSEPCKRDGFYEEYDNRGVLQSKYYIKNCLYNGSYETYYANGKLKERTLYNLGVAYSIIQRDSLGAVLKETNYLGASITSVFPKQRIRVVQNDSLQLFKEDALKFSCKISNQDIRCEVLVLSETVLIYSSRFLIITDKVLNPYKIHSINTLINHREKNGYIVFKVYDATDMYFTPLVDTISVKINH